MLAFVTALMVVGWGVALVATMNSWAWRGRYEALVRQIEAELPFVTPVGPRDEQGREYVAWTAGQDAKLRAATLAAQRVG